MQYQSKQPEKNLNDDLESLVTGGIVYYYEDTPTDEGQVGVYQENELWVVAHMREKGELFELGRFKDKQFDIKVANEYINDFKK